MARAVLVQRVMKLASFGFGIVALFALVGVGCGGAVTPGDPAPEQAPGVPADPGSPAPAPLPSGPASPAPSGPSAPNAPAAPLVGEFGYVAPPAYGGGVAVHAAANAASYDFQCMQGASGPIEPDASGAFTTTGSLTTTGGAITTFSGVTFSGTVSGDTLVLTATWQTTESTSTGSKPYTMTLGPTTLTRGVEITPAGGCI